MAERATCGPDGDPSALGRHGLRSPQALSPRGPSTPLPAAAEWKENSAEGQETWGHVLLGHLPAGQPQKILHSLSQPRASIMGGTGSAPTSQAGFKGSTRSNADTARRSPHAASRRVGCLSRVLLPGCAKSRAPGSPSTASHQGPGAQCLLSERTASGRTREYGRRATGLCQPSTLPSPRCLWFSSRWLDLLHPSLCVPPQRPEVRKL